MREGGLSKSLLITNKKKTKDTNAWSSQALFTNMIIYKCATLSLTFSRSSGSLSEIFYFCSYILNNLFEHRQLALKVPFIYSQKQPSRSVLRKRCSENTQQIYRWTPMPKCDFNKVALQPLNDCFKSSFWSWKVAISSFSYKHKKHFFEIFEYGGMHLKTDYFKYVCHLKHFSSATCNLNVLSYWNSSYV